MKTPTQISFLKTPMTNRVSRRSLLIGGVAALALSGLSVAPAAALTMQGAKSLVDATVKDINKVISSGKSERSMIKDFEKILVRYADVNVIARTTLGPDWRGLSNSEKSAFTKAFQGYIARKYGKR